MRRVPNATRRHRSRKMLLVLMVAVVFVCLLSFALIKLANDNKIVFTPGKMIYDQSVTEAEQVFLNSAVNNYTLPADITVSANTSTTRPADSNTLIYNISVPVTDFYSSQSNIASADVKTDPAVTYLDLSQLTYEQKLLSLDGNYFFDDYNNGAQFRSFTFNGDGSADLITHLANKVPEYPSNKSVLSLNQTGVTALSRAMVSRLNQVGDATYFSANIANFLKSSDLTHISNEVSFVDNCVGGTNSTVLCSDWRMLDTIADVGTDIIELTGNHNNDYSTTANLATINKYTELGYLTFGGGKDETSAAVPLEIDQKDTRLTLLGYNQSTSTKANGQGANGDNPGANIYEEAKASSDIAEAKARGDFVIVDVQYFECYSYPSEGQEMPACDAPITGQTEFFQHLIDLGADMVVGTQAHQPQTYELYKSKPIYYGLGNLFFDQTYWPGTERGIILTHYFYKNQLLQTRLTPTVYDTNLQVQPMDAETAAWFINRLNTAR